MQLPQGYEVRPATRGDADEITKMFVENEILLNGEPESSPEDLYDDWSGSGTDMDRDTWVVLSDDAIVAYAGIVKKVPPDIYSAYGGVHPQHWGRGIGTFLFEAVEGRVTEKAAGPARVRQWIDAKDRAAAEILERRGYSFVRRFWRMDVGLGDALVAARSIPDVVVRTFERDRDERRAHETLEAAFMEHWGFTPRTFEEAAPARWEAEWFRADLSLVAEVDDQMVGVCINGVRFGVGYVEDIGVVKEWRGRGIAEALLRHSFQIFRDLGLERASLNVDSDNTTGAMRLYERVGMRPGTSNDIYERPLQAA